MWFCWITVWVSLFLACVLNLFLVKRLESDFVNNAKNGFGTVQSSPLGVSLSLTVLFLHSSINTACVVCRGNPQWSSCVPYKKDSVADRRGVDRSIVGGWVERV